MSNEVLYILLPTMRAHEAVFLFRGYRSDEYALKKNPKYLNKVVSPTFGAGEINRRVPHNARLFV